MPDDKSIIFGSRFDDDSQTHARARARPRVRPPVAPRPARHLSALRSPPTYTVKDFKILEFLTTYRGALARMHWHVYDTDARVPVQASVSRSSSSSTVAHASRSFSRTAMCVPSILCAIPVAIMPHCSCHARPRTSALSGSTCISCHTSSRRTSSATTTPGTPGRRPFRLAGRRPFRLAGRRPLRLACRNRRTPPAVRHRPHIASQTPPAIRKPYAIRHRLSVCLRGHVGLMAVGHDPMSPLRSWAMAQAQA